MAPRIGRRLRRGAATTAVAAAAMAALTASQAPGFGGGRQDGKHAEATPPPDSTINGGSSYYTDLPPLSTPGKPEDHPGQNPGPGDAHPTEAGIPASVLDAYKKAESALRETHPGCNLPWQLLAAIGRVESGQARGGAVDAHGTTVKPILGPVLDGNGFARITDTDGGAYDGDTVHDRAVGPMQFIPSTWANWGADGNGDGRRDPNNIYDAALAAGHYLCAGGRDLSSQADLERSILGYNHSQEYLRTVLAWFEFYRKGTYEVPDGTGTVPSGPGPGDGRTNGSPPAHTPAPGGTRPGDRPGPGRPSPGDPGPSPSPAGPAARLASTGGTDLTATAGGTFTRTPRIRAVAADGRPVSGVRVRFEIRGDTQARFPGDTLRATVVTGSDGTAAAPAFAAGEQPGTFLLRASAMDRDLPPVDFTGTVRARPADALARTDDRALTAEAGGAFADQVTVRATYHGEPAPGVAVTATMVTSGGQPNDLGPYFKDAQGAPVRSLALKTDAEGRLALPQIFADDNPGTYLLRLTTADGGSVTVELTVTAPPSPSPSASSAPATAPAPASQSPAR
ncbi:lytic murein transglycosylase [Streptomyces sp. B1866]|uniref:lytic murein transglycosylase n=1 Tax=Streptomyces sp. B1866 TaxID=3075431 RepID=UPI00288D37B6|nr:lytic murein transglycosylase [Streptomyces sp. B1866]MDT3397903.1 lytic murein transglycosylase [Streptomyces sp. B1866]